MEPLFPRGWKTQIWGTRESKGPARCMLEHRNKQPLFAAPPSAPVWQQEPQPSCTHRLQSWAALPHPLVHIFFHGRIFWPDLGPQEFISLFICSILYQGFCFVINPAGFICQSSHQVGWVVPSSCCKAAHALLRVEALLTCSFAAWFSEAEDTTLFFSASLLEGECVFLMCF